MEKFFPRLKIILIFLLFSIINESQLVISSQNNNNSLNLTTENFYKYVGGNSYVIVLFYTNQNENCKKFSKAFEKLYQKIKAIRNYVIVAKMDIIENNKIARLYQFLNQNNVPRIFLIPPRSNILRAEFTHDEKNFKNLVKWVKESIPADQSELSFLEEDEEDEDEDEPRLKLELERKEILMLELELVKTQLEHLTLRFKDAEDNFLSVKENFKMKINSEVENDSKINLVEDDDKISGTNLSEYFSKLFDFSGLFHSQFLKSNTIVYLVRFVSFAIILVLAFLLRRKYRKYLVK